MNSKLSHMNDSGSFAEAVRGAGGVQVSSAAMLTPHGRGAIATVRVVGGLERVEAAVPSLFAAVNGRRMSDQPIGRIVFGRWGPAPAEEVVVCRTAADAFEVHCHGGSAAVRRILEGLESVGIRTLSWQSLNVRSDGLLATEFLSAMGKAGTLRAAGFLLGQYRGIFHAEIERLIQTAREGNADVFPDLLGRIDEILGWSQFGLHLTQPWKVVLTGRPNVGKSSLVNALLGYARSIVYAEPGTTRDVVSASTAFEGWVVELSDTAGIRATSQAIEAAGITLARERATSADCRVVVLDTSCPPELDDFELLRHHPDAIVVAHKADLPDVWGEQLPAGVLRVSSRTGTGVDSLGRALIARLVPHVPDQNAAVPATERQVRLLREARDAACSGDRARLVECLTALVQGEP